MIFLVRHGETEWNVAKRLQGQMDLPLNENGVAQAKQLGAYFQDKQIRFDHVYSSDLKRAYQTATAVTETLSIDAIIPYVALRERYYGELEGKLIDEIMTFLPQYSINFGEPMSHGMESLEDMQDRMEKTLTKIAIETDGSPTLVVSHGGAINAFLHRITNGERGTGKGKLANASFTKLDWKDNTFSIVAYNEHLHEAPTVYQE
ncbi:histidine phosphatase family protein [Aureibacillus halotolerans]|uniref:Putative phosphatase n=1 Tax=Aureibacillus halotolerans TaxID=1508390 RepID=A0A4R6TUF4_9BACI|nr:histidine phosphatase family protein [Aureibacillus halotolerans]TDQ36222.1 putative phosphatase [Aureibacillus halotolerans]